jgi:hypothetical protein
LFTSFQYDDLGGILTNPGVRTWKWSLLWDQSLLTKTEWNQDWRPLTLITYVANYHMSGYDPISWRITSLLIHIITSLGVYELGGPLAGLLFGIHPFSVIAVCYTWARSTSLVAMFGIWGCVLITKKYNVLPLLCLILAYLSKAEAIGAALAFIVLAYTLKNKKIMYGSIIITLCYFSIRTYLNSIWLLRITRSNMNPYSYGLTQCRVNLLYLSKWLAPWGLTAEDSGYVWTSSILDPRLWLAIVGLYLVLKWTSFDRKRFIHALCAISFMLPTSSIAPLTEPYNEHRTYSASAFVACIVVNEFTNLNPIIKGIYLTGLFGLSFKHVTDFRNELIFWSTQIDNASNNIKARLNLAIRLIDIKQYNMGLHHIKEVEYITGKTSLVDEALSYYVKIRNHRNDWNIQQ